MKPPAELGIGATRQRAIGSSAWASAPGAAHEKSTSHSSGIEYFELSPMCCEKASEGRRAAVAPRTTSEKFDSSVALWATIGPTSELTTSHGTIICVRWGANAIKLVARTALGQHSTLWARLCCVL